MFFRIISAQQTFTCYHWGQLEFDVASMAAGRERDEDGTEV